MRSSNFFRNTGPFLLQDVSTLWKCWLNYRGWQSLLLFLDSTSTTFQPFFLDFYKVHSLATHFFLRMWTESGAAFGDFTRVVALVRSQYVFICYLYINELYWIAFAELKLHFEARMSAHGMKLNMTSLNVNTVPSGTDKWRNWNWRTIFWARCQYGESDHLSRLPPLTMHQEPEGQTL